MSNFDLPKKISILGATGSIGKNTLDVLAHHGGADNFDIVAITGMSNVELLSQQAKEFNAKFVVTADETKYSELKDLLAGTDIEVGAGREALIEAGKRDSDWVMAAIVGMAGLAPTIAAAERGADIALANKECLVSAGTLFKSIVEKGGGRLLPVDSEHSAIFQVLNRKHAPSLDKIILTASGGPYRNFTRSQMANVTPISAAAHPKWSMGTKISIDSASMFNKALEMIEAMHLFDTHPDKIDVVVHPQSIIHSLVSYCDGSVLAQLGEPDMRTAIGYALAYPNRIDLPVEKLDLVKLAQLDFEAPDEEKFPSLRLARQSMKAGGLSGAIFNASKEVALDAFIDGKIGFLKMADIVEDVLAKIPARNGSDIDIQTIYNIDVTAREEAQLAVNKLA